MNEFEIWFYRALIASLLLVIFWLTQSWVNKQDEKNKLFFELMDKNQQAINALNVILNSNKEICTEKHINVNRRLDNVEAKR